MSISDGRFLFPNPPTSTVLSGIANDLPVVIVARFCLELIRQRPNEQPAAQRQIVRGAGRPPHRFSAP